MAGPSQTVLTLLAGLGAGGLVLGAWAIGLPWHGATGAYETFLLSSFLAVWAGAEGFLSGRTGADANPDATLQGQKARSLAGLNGLLLLAIFACPLLIGHAGGASASAIVFGSLALALGLTLRCLAIRGLGRRFNSDNSIADNAVLETSGPYRLLAHPSEVGLLLIAAGALCLIGKSADFLWLAPLYGLMTARVALEEAALIARHQNEYRRYRRARFDPIPSLSLHRKV